MQRWRTSMRVSTIGVGTGLALALALLAAPARAEQPKATPPAEPPQAEDVLREMSTYLAKAKAFSYHGEVDFDQILPGGLKIRLPSDRRGPLMSATTSLGKRHP